VTLYQDWPEGITEATAISLTNASVAAFWKKNNYQMGPVKVLTGNGKHNLGDFSGTSSVKVAGRCCRAVGCTTPDCSGANGLTVEVQSLEERVEKFESAVQAGNISLHHAGEATPAKTITVMSTNSECAFKYER
jgi:hypothetical protein